MTVRQAHSGGPLPPPVPVRRKHAPASFVNQFVLDVRHRVDFANLIVGKRARNESSRPAFEIPESALVPIQPMPRLLREYLFNLLARPRLPRRQIQIAPIDSPRLSLGRIP